MKPTEPTPKRTNNTISPNDYKDRASYLAAKKEAQQKMRKVLDFFRSNPGISRQDVIIRAGLDKSVASNMSQMMRKEGPPNMMLAYAAKIWEVIQTQGELINRKHVSKEHSRALWLRYGVGNRADYLERVGQYRQMMKEVVEWLERVQQQNIAFIKIDFVHACGINPTPRVMNLLYQMNSTRKYDRLLTDAPKLHAGMKNAIALNPNLDV